MLWILRLILTVPTPTGLFKLCEGTGYHCVEKCSEGKRTVVITCSPRINSTICKARQCPSPPYPCQQSFCWLRLPLPWPAWLGPRQQRVSDGPYPSEAEPQWADKWKFTHEANPMLRRSHQRVPWNEVLKDANLRVGEKETILTTEKAGAVSKSVVSDFFLNILTANDYCSETTSLFSTDSRGVQSKQRSWGLSVYGVSILGKHSNLVTKVLCIKCSNL